MRKWLMLRAAALALALIVLLAAVRYLGAPPISTGKPLPRGKVTPQLVSTWDTATFLAPDGSLWEWGGTMSAGLVSAFPKSSVSQVPRRAGSASDWKRIDGDMLHTVAIKEDGSLWAWGLNRVGEIGRKDLSKYYSAPVRIGTDSNWDKISVGFGRHALALKNDGSLWAWGMNQSGQLGDGSTNNTAIPIMIGRERDWRQITAGDESSFALKRDGTVWGWGGGGSNMVLTPTQIDSGTNWLSIAAFDPSYGPSLLALKTDGTLWLYIAYFYGFAKPVPGLSSHFRQIGSDKDWAEVYRGSLAFVARKRDGTWWRFDQDLARGFSGRINIYRPSPQRFPFEFDPWAFATGPGTTLLLGKDGRLWNWGKRLGMEDPSPAQKKIRELMNWVFWNVPALDFLFRSDRDEAPFVLWELPPEVRRSLGTSANRGAKDATSGE
jgi:alpha-tubulin suppressor-like RCC1 family protein